MKPRKAHCLFEQSGTFKNEFIKLGIQAEDYDILNDFGETDHIIDLYEQINIAYERERESIFDKMTSDDIVMAFFPCTRFEDQIQLQMRGQASNQKKYSDEKKLELSMKYFNECNENFQLISKLVMVAYRKGLKLIIENPYSKQHILYRYWSVRPSEIDLNRHAHGDHYKKPTMYYFINCEPKCNLLFEGIELKEIKKVSKLWGMAREGQIERSMISPDYARWFIKEKILDEEDIKREY